MNSDLWGINDVGFSESHTCLSSSGPGMEIWGIQTIYGLFFFGAELSGGVPGAGEGMKKYNLLAMLRYG